MSLVATLKSNLLEELRKGHFNKPAATVGVGVLGVVWIYRYTEYLKRKAMGKATSSQIHDHDEKMQQFANVSFIQHMRKLLPLMFPKLISRETGYIVLLGILLTIRTGLSSIIADAAGKAAGYIVSKRVDAAVRNLAGFILFTIPAAYVNSSLKYFTAILSLSIRTNMNKYIHDKYLQGVNFYNICNLGNYKIDVAERITVDIQHFSEEVSDIFTSTFKPVMDIIFFTYKLSQTTTYRGPVILYSYFLISSLCKMLLAPPLGQLGARESELQGDFRSAHERLITNSEEVAFYDGSARERIIINKKLDQLKDQVVINSCSKLFINVIDNVIVKYWATLAGYIAIFSPVLFGISSKKSATELAEDYARNTRYLSSLSDAIGSFVLLGNKISELKGHVYRVGELVLTLDAISHETMQQFVRQPPEPLEFSIEQNDAFLKRWKEQCDARIELDTSKKKIEVAGVKIIEKDHIVFKHIDIVSPEGKVLVEDLSFEVNRFQNVMVTGPNGSGKSSLFRIIGDLWPPSAHKEGEALIIKPNKKDIVFIPQKPYLVLGTLRDQVIYPHSKDDMEKSGVTDEDLAELLRIVDPKEHILNTWTWDDEKDWFHAFSGGQKQRVAMARLFYHRPQYAILDECTSSVSDEVEDVIYESAKTVGITLFTVSHRTYLTRHHKYVLTLEGRDGKWTFNEIGSNQETKIPHFTESVTVD